MFSKYDWLLNLILYIALAYTMYVVGCFIYMAI